MVEFSHGGMCNHFRYKLDIIKIEKLWLIKTRGQEEWTVNSIVIHHKIVFTRDSRKYPNKYFLKDLDTINWVKSDYVQFATKMVTHSTMRKLHHTRSWECVTTFPCSLLRTNPKLKKKVSCNVCNGICWFISVHWVE